MLYFWKGGGGVGVCESNNPLPESHSILRKCREMLAVATIATMETKIFLIDYVG